MLVYGLDNETFDSFYFFKNLEIKREINKLDISSFEIPKDYRNIFETECKVIENKQSYTIKNIEPFYDGYKIECKQNIDEWLSFFHKSLNFPYKDIETMIKGIIPSGWSYKISGEIKKYRTITADHKSSWEVLEEIVKKFDVEFRIDNNEKILFISEEIGEDKGVFFSDNFNVVDKDISVESFEFATRIIPEGMNGLKINQINDGKDYLENKSYSGKTINYYWKDERYTNIQNLKDEAARKLEVLSRPRVSIKLKVKDLSKAIGVYEQEYSIGDYVYLIDKDRKTKERFRILAETTYPNRPFNNEITLANKPLDLVSDVDENIELTKEMWEETRVRFETTEDAIKSSVATAKRYSDDSFKTYKTEREQTDSRIYESITESTTYVDPKTGQTKPIIDKQLEIDKTIDGINISLRDQLTANKDFNLRLDNLRTNISENTLSLNSKIDKDLAKAKKELGDSIDYTKIDFKKRHDLLALELENANNDINKAKEKISGLSNNFDDFNTRANNKYEVIDREILGIKSNFKIARDEISAEIVSASKTQEKAIKEMGDDTESKIKTFLNLNYSTKTQTDQKISQEVGSLKTLVNADISNLEKEIVQTKSKIEQTDAKISSQVTLYEVSEIVDSKTSDFNRRITETESKITQTDKKIESKVSKDGFGSLVKQEFDSYKVQARNINFDGSFVNIKGTFQTLNDSNDVGIKIDYNNIRFQDNRWNGRVFGNINVTRQIGDAEGFSLNMGHYKDGYLGLSYFNSSDGLWHDYVNFDIYGKSRFSTSGYATSFLETVKFNKTVLFDSNIHVLSSATFNSDCKFERNITFGGNRVRFVNYSDGFGIVNEKGEGLYVAGSGAVYVQDTQAKYRVAIK